MQRVTMTVFPRVTIADGVPNADQLAAVISSHGDTTVTAEHHPDVFVVDASAVIADSTVAAVQAGAGLVVLVSSTAAKQAAAQTINLLAQAGIELDPEPADGPAAAAREETTQVTDLDLLARVHPGRLTVTGALRTQSPAAVLLRSDAATDGPGRATAAVAHFGAGRVVVLANAITDATDELFFNAVTYAAGHLRHRRAAIRSATTAEPAWQQLKSTVTELQGLQATDGSVPGAENQVAATALVQTVVSAITEIAPRFPHDSDYLAAVIKDFTRWSEGGFAVPDFLDSLISFHPEGDRVDGREHLVIFPMYTQNGSTDRHVEAVLVQVIWPEFVAKLEAGAYSNKLFVPIRFLDFTPGYDTNSAVLFPETVAMREVPKFTWGAIFADREAARFRTVISAAAKTTQLALPPDAARLLEDQHLTEETFVMWDLIHDRTHMRGDLPFDPFMIKQRMPYFLYSLEELRCDLTAFRESVALERQGVPHARLVQYAVIFDRIFRFAITGSRVRNYDGLGGQLLFAWLHQHRVLHWTDNRMSIEWDRVADAVLELGEQIETLYWRSIDRPKISHWLAAYQLVANTVEPHPASTWAKGVDALPVSGPPKGMTDAVLPDEFPLSMFYEALSRKLAPVVTSTAGITG